MTRATLRNPPSSLQAGLRTYEWPKGPDGSPSHTLCSGVFIRGTRLPLRGQCRSLTGFPFHQTKRLTPEDQEKYNIQPAYCMKANQLNAD